MMSHPNKKENAVLTNVSIEPPECVTVGCIMRIKPDCMEPCNEIK